MKRGFCALLMGLIAIFACAAAFGERWEYGVEGGSLTFEADVARPARLDMPLLRAKIKTWNTTLDLSPGQFQYRSEELSLTDYLSLYRFDISGGNASGSLDGFSPDEASSMMREALLRLGVEAGEVLRETAMDEAMLQKCRDARVEGILSRYSGEEGLLYAKEERDTMSQIPLPDEGYLIRMGINYRGVALTCMPNQKNSFDGYASGDIVGYVTRNGILYLETTPGATVYEVIESKTPERKALTAEEARDRMIARYRNQAITIKRVTYEYVPVEGKKGIYVLRPAWAFYAKAGAGMADYPIYIDVYTGKEL